MRIFERLSHIQEHRRLRTENRKNSETFGTELAKLEISNAVQGTSQDHEYEENESGAGPSLRSGRGSSSPEPPEPEKPEKEEQPPAHPEHAKKGPQQKSRLDILA